MNSSGLFHKSRLQNCVGFFNHSKISYLEQNSVQKFKDKKHSDQLLERLHSMSQPLY